MPVTLADIAREAGVNVSRVSRALNGGYGVRKEVRERILGVAERLNYRPNLVAKGLVTGRSYSLGLLVSDIRNPFFAELARGVGDVARKAGYDVILYSSDLDPDRQMECLRSLVNKSVDGIIMNTVAFLSPAQIKEIVGYSVPVVLLNQALGPHPFSVLQPDNMRGGELAARYLTGLGHRRMAVMTGPRKHTNLTARVKGFLSALRDVPGVEPPEIVNGMHDSRGGYETAKRMLAQRRKITAIFAANDAMALGVIRAVQEAGLSLPDDLSLVGFDDIDVAAIVNPPLTTIWAPKYEMGEACAEVLLKIAGKADALPEHRVFSVKLVERKSCRAIPMTAGAGSRDGVRSRGKECQAESGR
jgi:LacI family transcriptional regulator